MINGRNSCSAFIKETEPDEKKNDRINDFLKDTVIGIDLHGTLLDKNWCLPQEIIPELISVFQNIKTESHIFICTGNDLSFVREAIPGKIRNLIDGYILENGCVFSDGEEEQLLISHGNVNMIKTLERELTETGLPDLLFTGQRLGTISLFTSDRGKGVAPDNLYSYLKQLLVSHPQRGKIKITHSDVAVDILPADHSKFRGISQVCPQKKIIAIADSCNDWEFLQKADYTFLPLNCYSHIEKRFRQEGYRILPLSSFNDNEKGKDVYKSNMGYTYGVLDILKKIENKQKKGSRKNRP